MSKVVGYFFDSQSMSSSDGIQTWKEVPNFHWYRPSMSWWDMWSMASSAWSQPLGARMP
ncbi:hypothetical protein D3C77_632260 [compost metagenome]